MNLYTSFLLFNIVMTVFSKNLGIKTGLETPIPWSIGLKFFTEIKNNDQDDYLVEVYSDECCLDGHDTNCNIVKIIGSASEVINGGTTKTLEMVAPLLDPYERRGHCTLYVDSRLVSKPKNIIRDTLKVKFNTKIKKGNVPDNVKQCKYIDEDPLNDCKPVNCDTYYNGKRSHYSVIKKRCVAVPTCAKVGGVAAYNPSSNKCVYKPLVSKQDIDYVKDLTRNGKNRTSKNVIIIKPCKGNGTATTIITEDIPNKQSQAKITHLEFQTVDEKDKKVKEESVNVVNIESDSVKNEDPQAPSKATDKFQNAKPTLKETVRLGDKLVAKIPIKSERISYLIRYCSDNRYTTAILIVVIFLQCCLICTMVYCIIKSCGCFRKKLVINRFFNHRQDASVTTPLIGTSNIDTETTEYQYFSESSNYIDKKIKCYKACQKERKNNMKLSMSDDILSKCLTRRDWHRLPRSETIPEVNIEDEILYREKKEVHGCQRKGSEMKVNFKDEHQDKKTKVVKSIVKKESKSNAELHSDSSEREIRCHSYNYDNGSNLTGFKQSSQCNTYGVHHQGNKKKSTHSIEKAAQAYFSNDSIDDFISERGVLFIGDNASKYSFTSISSAAKSSVSSHSSKTSKNNIMKNVMTLLSRKQKGPSSDPGANKSKTELDLELLHISRASVFSSSNETDGEKDLKKIKESTSSL